MQLTAHKTLNCTHCALRTTLVPLHRDYDSLGLGLETVVGSG
jgi:hypothetical protein